MTLLDEIDARIDAGDIEEFEVIRNRTRRAFEKAKP